MPNQLTATGLTIASLSEITGDITTAMQTIYGADINVNSNSPDGQLINVFAQVTADQLSLLEQVYNSFTVSAAVGIYVDQLVALNGLIRLAGTYSTITVAITVTQSVTLQGLDGNPSQPNVYTLQDAAGNQFVLLSSTTIPSGSATLIFQAVDLGPITTPLSTPIQQVTVITGVSSAVTQAQTLVGTNEESDAALKLRQQQSFWLGTVGPADSILAALLETVGVIDAFVPENDTASTADGVGAHSIWAIVNAPTSSADAIAQTIYTKKAPGCGMTGSSNGNALRPNGGTYVANFDYAIAETLYVHFSIVANGPGISFDNTAIKAALAAALVYKLGQSPNIGNVIVAMLEIAPQGYLTGVGVSIDNSSFLDTVSPSDFQHYFTLLAADITII